MKNEINVIINVKKVLGSEIGFSLVEKTEKIIDEVDEYKLLLPITINVKLTNLGEHIIADIHALTVIDLVCTRCLKSVSNKLQLHFQNTFALDPQEEEFTIYNNNTIDLWPAIRQEILLNIPTKLLCSKNCVNKNYKILGE